MKVIRIADVIHEQLKREARSEGRTLQWVVENKLTGNTPSPKNTEPKTFTDDFNLPGADVSDLFADKNKIGATPVPETPTSPLSLEQDCCLNETRPCKHWVWDSAGGEGYRNLLSGRLREAE